MLVYLKSEKLTVTINSAGAEICSIKNSDGIEFIWGGDPAIWGRHAPVLFPIVGRLKTGSYVFNQQSYQLGQHGFARDMAFLLDSSNESECTFSLSSNEDTKRTFPFDFHLKVKYHLSNARLLVNYEINNPSDETMYFSIGAHPGFNCPLLAGERFEDYYLEFDKDELMRTKLTGGLRDGTEKLLLADKKLYLTKALFDNDALVFEGGQIEKVTLRSEKSPWAVILESRGWPYFGIWTKKGSTAFICLEPWHGITDSVFSSEDLEQKTGIMPLKPASTFSCDYTIQLI